MTGWLRELQRRNVVRAIILYATAVWALAQGIAQLAPVVGAPDGVTRWFLVAAAIGFPFWVAFAWFYEFTPGGIKRESVVDDDKAALRATGRRLDFWIIGALSVAVVLLLTDRFISHNTSPSVSGPIIAEKSIAVLPLVNESGDPNALYFSDGLSEDFINALSQFSGLRVIARSSSFQFRDSKDSPSTIGAKLGVAHLLEGSVQRAGDTVRIVAELINARDGTTLWSQRYDRPYKDLFQVQDDVTHAVAAALRAKLLGGANVSPPQTDRPPSGNLDAYNALLEARFYSRQASETGFRKAVEADTRAVQIDPKYALAWANLSLAWSSLGISYLGGEDAQQAYAKARNAADTAMSLAPDSAAAHNARGFLLFAHLDRNGATAEWRRALQFDPDNASIKSSLAGMLAEEGKLDEAVELCRQALITDPLNTSIYDATSLYLGALGRLDDAEKAIRKAIALEPASDVFYWQLATIDMLRGDAKSALANAQQASAGVLRDFAVAQALQIGSDRDAADAALKSLIDQHGSDGAYQIAETYGLRKDPDKMFEWLEKARTLRDPGILGLLYDPLLLPYRRDPRFAKLCEELNLPVPQS